MSENENTKAKILEVAGNLFLTKGYEETRISDIINGWDRGDGPRDGLIK